MKLLIDMNLSPRWTQFLASQGFEAVHWSAVGNPAATDDELMGYAASEELIVLTQDLDFGSILAVTGGGKPSVVQLRSGELSPVAIGDLVVRALRQVEAELAAGALVTIDAERVRVTLLPLGEG